MGYRSEVLLYVGSEVMPQFMVTMAKCSEARTLCFGDADEHVKDYQDIKGSMLFKWGWLKWYDSFPCVSAIEDFMERACEALQKPQFDDNAVVAFHSILLFQCSIAKLFRRSASAIARSTSDLCQPLAPSRGKRRSSWSGFGSLRPRPHLASTSPPLIRNRAS